MFRNLQTKLKYDHGLILQRVCIRLQGSPDDFRKDRGYAEMCIRARYNGCQSLLCPACFLRAGRQGRRTVSAQWFLQDLRWKVDTAPLFYACPGRKIQLQIHPLNLWKPVASCRPCVLSPHLRIASAPEPGTDGIGTFSYTHLWKPTPRRR